MFNRIRYAAHVLSLPKSDPYQKPDILFEEDRPEETGEVSRSIGGLIEVLLMSFVIGAIEVLLMSFVIGAIAAPPLAHVWPMRTIANADRTTAVLAALLGMAVMYSYERFKILFVVRLKIGARIAPYFGHRITRAVRTLRS
jgi:hypothetical protein